MKRGDRVLRKGIEGHDYGRRRVPFTDDGIVLAILEDGVVMVRWRVSKRDGFEKAADLEMWKGAA